MLSKLMQLNLVTYRGYGGGASNCRSHHALRDYSEGFREKFLSGVRRLKSQPETRWRPEKKAYTRPINNGLGVLCITTN